MKTSPIYVVVMATGGSLTEAAPVKGGPIVMETDVDGATLQVARERAAALEKRYGACRVGRVIFENEPNFEVKQ